MVAGKILRRNKGFIRCICMNLRGVAVLELNTPPDYNKGPDHTPCPKTHSKDHRS